MAHPDRLDRAKPPEDPAGLHVDLRPPVLPARGPDHPAPEPLGQPHHPVAEPEDREPHLDDSRVRLRRAVGIDALGPPREDDPLRALRPDLLGRRAER